ncbi:hypothetical protein ACA910_007353 [Epithemia clementina (nom. ined.)]
MAIPETITLNSQGLAAAGGGEEQGTVADEESHLLPGHNNNNNYNNVNRNHDGIHLTNGGAASLLALRHGPPATGGATMKMKPMDHLEHSRRKNVCWSVSLLIVFLALIGSMAVWRYQDLAQGATNNNNDDDSSTSTTTTTTTTTPISPLDLTLQQVEERSANAREVLNKHYRRQSKIMAAGCEGTVLIIRHCDKYGPNVFDPNGDEHCSYVGMERTHFIKTLFALPSPPPSPPPAPDQSMLKSSPATTQTTNDNNFNKNNGNDYYYNSRRWPVPSYLFALTADRGTHLNFRERETLHPLSVQSGVGIDMMDPPDMPPRIFDLLQSGAMCGRLAVICWKHEYIPDLAVALGCGPTEGCPLEYPHDSFDQVWQIKYVFRPSTNTDDGNSSNGSHNRTAAGAANRNDDGDGNDDDGNPIATTSGGGTRGRRHVKHYQRDPKNPNDAWFVYATVQQQNFDPLAFSAHVGDYAPEGVPSGGRWKDEI